MTGVLVKTGNLDTETDAEGEHTRACIHTRTHREHHLKMKTEIRVMLPLNIAVNYQQLGERPGIDSPSQPPEGTNPANTLISASSLQKMVHVRQYISVAETTQFVALSNSNPSKPVHQPSLQGTGLIHQRSVLPHYF